MDMTNQISNWAGGGATVTLGAAQLLYGLNQKKKNKRPEYEIPPEIQQNLTQGQMEALQGLPEAQKQMFIQNVSRSQSAGLGQLSSRKAGLTGVAAMNQNANDAYSNLLAQDASAAMQNRSRLYDLRQNMANYKDQQFQLNKMNPYYEKAAQSEALMGAGMQNMSQGFQSSNSGGDFSGMSSSGKGMSTQGYSQEQQDQAMQPFSIKQNSGLTNPYRTQSYNTGLTNPFR